MYLKKRIENNQEEPISLSPKNTEIQRQIFLLIAPSSPWATWMSWKRNMTIPSPTS